MNILIPFIWCILELMISSAEISQHISKFMLTKDRRASSTVRNISTRYTNSSRSRTVSIHNYLEAERRKDYIRRQICHILKCEANQQPSTQPSTIKPQVPKDNTQDDPILSEPADFTKDTSCMQFPIPVQYLNPDVKLSNGDIRVYIKVKKRKNRKRKRKISLRVSLIDNNNNNQTIIASRKFKLKSTKWQNIHLPSTLIKSIKKQRMKVLKICIHCNKCNKKVRVEFPLKRKSKRKKKNQRRRKIRKIKLRKNRPRLLLYSKREGISDRFRRNTFKTCSANCCKRIRFIPFSSLHLPQEVLFPSGFTYEECTKCSESFDTLTSDLANDVTICKPTQKSPLNLDIKFEDGIEFTLSIPNIRVNKCQCHIQ
ncbi:uncharacterized protein LOC133193739 [Saccostrea echinata]|uniref:uncharacterized protein LOC133193739 n=1 Tax=Saccostrea echinata TaxID=191078 RepID=UPI002A839CD8|nr:uncharacterized protein LOC133193739 [Saccostrea echinata]